MITGPDRDAILSKFALFDAKRHELVAALEAWGMDGADKLAVALEIQTTCEMLHEVFDLKAESWP
jgi:hypothetical protein